MSLLSDLKFTRFTRSGLLNYKYIPGFQTMSAGLERRKLILYMLCSNCGTSAKKNYKFFLAGL